MRKLLDSELRYVAGAGGECSSGGEGGNNYGGVTDPSSIGTDMINAYEGVVAAVSHIIERVANAF